MNPPETQPDPDCVTSETRRRQTGAAKTADDSGKTEGKADENPRHIRVFTGWHTPCFESVMQGAFAG
ncbi:MAG: hypothetical protein LBR88_05390 [Zoogloeaceae bacterium]|nr:hypothetical protein [Zoogloeaceae bacterium]